MKKVILALFALILAGCSLCLAGCASDGGLMRIIHGNYEFTGGIRPSSVTDENIRKMAGMAGAITVAKDGTFYYRDGAYGRMEARVFIVNDEGEIYIDAEQLGKLLGDSNARGYVKPERAGEIFNLNVTMYEGKMAVFTPKDVPEPSAFTSLYTFEALYLRLISANETELKNAFIDLPVLVSDGKANTVFYSAPDLNLGLQTTVYYDQLGEAEVALAPKIVAGQGESSENNTLVRVFNEQECCTAQFLAFPEDVTGGVQVAAGTVRTEGGSHTCIAAAAFDTDNLLAKSVRIFDESGLLLADIKISGISSPYVIAAGKFTDSDSDCLAVMSRSQSGSGCKINLYSLENYSLIKTEKFTCNKSLGRQQVQMTRSSGKNGGKDTLLIYFTESRKGFMYDCTASKVSSVDISLSSETTGLYTSAFEGRTVATVNNGVFSQLNVYTPAGTGYSETNVNVGWRENRFYSTYANDNRDGYVDRGSFRHVRADLAAPISSELSGSRTGDAQMNESSIEHWSVSFGSVSDYHAGYNMWEPCFTHRWNNMRFTNILMGIKDENGYPKYASIGRNDNIESYLELGSSFFIGTYADGLLNMAKMRLFTLRTYLRGLSVEFRGENGEPEKLIAVSPVHEQEIDVSGSVGDYNPSMIKGFRNYLLNLYGTLDNINDRFGTEFRSINEIDPPRYDPESDIIEEPRGAWDVYGESDYFTQWSLYSRYIINKRILEAYREALLAGFPPEAINAHQIPEGDAVSGFLGEANTRISPVDVVTACGTSYGGTRYGYWMDSEKNFVNLAFKAGHTNITLGEYGSLSTKNEAYRQLVYMFEHGVRMTHVIIPVESGTPQYASMAEAERYAARTLQERNIPRTVNTGITKDVVAVSGENGTFDIIQMGKPTSDGKMSVGLLKSVKEDGSWDGTVYLSPFRTEVKVEKISMKKNSSGVYVSDKISSLQYGDQVELTFLAEGSGNARVRIEVYNGKYVMSQATTEYEIGSSQAPKRFVFSNQLPMEDVTIKLTVVSGKVTVRNLSLTAQRENIARKYFDDYDAAANHGGVTYDVIR